MMTAKQKKWQELISEWESMEISQSEFCKERGLTVSAFQYWRRRLREPEKVGGGFVRLSPPSAENFFRVEYSEELGWSVELKFPVELLELFFKR